MSILTFVRSAFLCLGFLLGASSFASGVSGGGGTVMFPVDPRDPAPVSEVRQSIARVRPAVLAYFRTKQDLFRRGNLSPEEQIAFGPLFGRGPGIVAVAERTPVDSQVRRPCFDSAKNPVDGSVYSDEAGEICLSALTISKRVERSDVPAQSAALIAHEFTEILGFEESDAVRVQAKVLEDFRRSNR